jgi:hypothetical protein
MYGLISKELLSLVLETEYFNRVTSVGEVYENRLSFKKFETERFGISVYELEFKCKEWIVKQEHDVEKVVSRTFCIRENTSALGSSFNLLLYPNQPLETALFSSCRIEDLVEFVAIAKVLLCKEN